MNQLRNQVQLIGRLGRDPEVKKIDNDRMLAKFPLATEEVYRNEQGAKLTDTQWHNIVIWGKLAKVAEDYLRKGREVAIKGKLTYRMYEDKEGGKKHFTEVVAYDLLLLGAPAKENTEAKTTVEEEFLPF